ncbi:MAG: NrfD/PsrC family molybdoenzyme membrane anchor subunit [Syntrophales bacterium]|jgi:molybdopterin-containing oxidoreductase family membrane subunit
MTGFGNIWKTIDIGGVWRRIASGGAGYHALLLFFGLMAVVGAAAGIHALFIVGSRHGYATYREIPLALLISTYTFFIGASTGIYIISSFGHVFGFRELMPIAKRTIYLSIITVLAGYMSIGLEIENPIRMFIYVVLSPNLRSNIWWMSALYAFFLFFMVIGFFLLLVKKYRVAAIAGFLAVVSVIAADSNMGGIFAMMHGRQFWYGPFLPVYFIASAMMTGCAFIMFFTLLAYRIKKEPLETGTARSIEFIRTLSILMVAIIMFFTFWKILTGIVGDPQEIENMRILIAGSYAFNFWVFEILCGMVVPFILLLASKGERYILMLIASAMMIIGIFFIRLDLVIIGQIVPMYFDLGVKEFDHLHTYWPSLHEILVVLGCVGFCCFAYLLGEKIFDGFKESDQCLSPEAIDNNHAEELQVQQ